MLYFKYSVTAYITGCYSYGQHNIIPVLDIIPETSISMSSSFDCLCCQQNIITDYHLLAISNYQQQSVETT